MYSKESIIKIVKLKGKIAFRDLARQLKVKIEDNGKFSSFLASLMEDGDIALNSAREYFVPPITAIYTDVIRMNAKGFGFVDHQMDDGSEINIFVPAQATRKAMDGDTVQIAVFADPTREKSYQGIVREIVIRKRTTFVGRIVRHGDHFEVKPLDNKITGIFRFQDEKNLKSDYEVKVEITKFGRFFHTVRVIKTLGHKDDTAVDILAAIEDAGIPYEFNPFTISEAKKLPATVNANEITKRTDLRERMIVTVDGDDTKDFDDAIEVRQLENGNYLLGVHIADVTHYVLEGSALDDEALTRGTSVYLADRVIPMLPEALSNGICSLNPNADRLVISAEMEINSQGDTVSYQIFPGVINSKYRLTYQEVNKFYRGQKKWDDNRLELMLRNALALSKIIRRKKEREGYIDFEIEESKIIINEQGKTIDIVPRERFESEMLIEDFMVRANEVVAAHTYHKNLAFIYRIHDKPDLERVTSLQNVVKLLGIDVKIPHSAVPLEFAKTVKQIKETRFDDFMKVMLLRTMAKAEYAPKNIGHFGLASKFYTHFTSPIRRYPDLMVHRMLRTYFFENRPQQTNHFAQILPEIAERSSSAEVRSVELERRVADIKKAEFYEKFIGQSFTGTIVSLMGFGFFVEFPNKVDGLVHISTLAGEEYSLTNGGYSLVSKNRVFNIGDKVDVTVVGTIKDEGKISLVLSDMYESWIKDRNEKKS